MGFSLASPGKSREDIMTELGLLEGGAEAWGKEV